MNPAQPSPSERDLEALSRQLRSLAQHLLRDPDAAADLVQEAWLAALNRPREHVVELGAWLRVVVRNLAARRVRCAVLRTDAEFERAASEPARETEELLERSNIALALRDAAHELPEPVRSVIELHYFEVLTLEATAARLARPLETVRSQRKRGVELLRAVLAEPIVDAGIEIVAALAPTHGQLSWEDVEAGPLACMRIDREARDTLRSELVGGPLDADTDWIERRFGATSSGGALHDAHVRAIEMSPEIGVARGEHLDELDRAVRPAIRDGRFVKGAGDIAESPASRSDLYRQHSRMGRWSTLLSLGRDE